ncbi:hypothetical protein [Streptomyces sp. NPDC059759]|uniref:hypothetical protein n=1 Tax=Streptomyces sp. NPDC059759 TaxID=3346936 RepID=UPI003657E5AA
MDAQKQVVTVDRHEWSLTSPTHHTEIDKTIAVANHERGELASKGVRTGDVHVWSHDGKIVVSFEAERPKVATRRTAVAAPEAADA